MKKHNIYIVLLLIGWNLQAQVVLSDKNYIHTVTPQAAMTIAEMESVNCSNINDIDRAIESVTYFDGLGRPIQQRAIKASPNGKDIVTHIEYDVYGRQTKQYLPFEADSHTGAYKDVDVNIDVNQYYRDNYQSDFPGISLQNINAYSESIFEPSPLNRITEVGAPGTAWKANRNSDADHTIKTDWYTNKTNEVLYHKVVFANPSDTEKPSLVQDGYYDANQLYITITHDENWTTADGNNHTTKEYKDKQGRVVLKRNFNEGSAHDTYYVYDRFGKLTYVISPKVNVADGVSESELSELCYQYHYDHRNRLIEKKVPGKGKECIVYNKLDQPILTQDANLKASNTWLFTKYDVFGRVTYTGKVSDNRERKVIQQVVDGESTLWEKRSAAAMIDGTTIYYSNEAFPKTNLELHTINYYDDYGFDLAGVTNPGTAYGKTISDQTKTLPTGSKVRVLETLDWITTVTYYDKKSRPIHVASKNEYLNTTDIVESKLDFVGKVEETKTIHTKGSNAPIVTIDTFTYDHMGRPLTQSQKINDQAVETIVENRYDKLGQLESKKTGGGLQEVDYTYNVRGWLTKINDPNTALGNKLFAFKINYNTPQHGATALFNGNISETTWKTANDNVERHYKYSYDALNRITEGISSDGNYNLSGVTYDKTGNILSLNRKGNLNEAANSFGDMDILTYTYDSGNKLLKVADTGNTTFGFKDGSNTGNDYAYDSNGNMTVDNNKNISGIVYNHLNLPTRINVNGGAEYINYIYDAIGTKLKKIATTNNGKIFTEYAGNYVYKNSNLEFFNHSEGIVEHEADGYKYVYQYRDHLQNVRLSYKDANKDGVITQDEIVQEKNYYPFGLKMRGINETLRGRNHNYGFNGVEQMTDLDLNIYEMDVRKYDPSIARFTSIDPVTHHSMSTYNAFDNNPIFWADPSGADATSLINEIFQNSSDKSVTKWSNNGNGTFSGSNGKSAGTKTENTDIAITYKANRTNSGKKGEDGSDIVHLNNQVNSREKSKNGSYIYRQKNIYMTAVIESSGKLSTIQIKATERVEDQNGNVIGGQTATSEVDVLYGLSPEKVRANNSNGIFEFLVVVQAVQEHRNSTGHSVMKDLQKAYQGIAKTLIASSGYSAKPGKKFKSPKTLPQRLLGLVPATAGVTMEFSTKNAEKMRLPVIQRTRMYEN
ncbi:DUF6443 domain-containing protein [Aquimarina megaterium]|uniref:DUF6443 domain-containing protein n=1 Tax=Aquimarina megaterium TaxID=1443666 RepID=UPI0009432717|nr:DUF6443 domain-containing protein [Aquimarina megaterium]